MASGSSSKKRNRETSSFLEPVLVTRIPALGLPSIILSKPVTQIGRDSFGPDSSHHVLGWVSASHCVISKKDDDTVWLEQHADCKNGVFLNNSTNALGAGQKVQLEEGDTIHLVKVFVPLWIEVVYVFRNGEPPTTGPSIYGRAVTNDAAVDDKHLECAACLEPMVAAVTVAPCGHSFDLRCLSHHWHVQAGAGRPLTCLAGGCTAPPASSRANEELRRLVESAIRGGRLEEPGV